MNPTLENPLCLSGEPAVFMGSNVKNWEHQIRVSVAGLKPPDEPFGVHMRFRVGNFKRGGHFFDLDNLVKPVFDCLAMPEARWVEATMELSPSPGLEICLTTCPPENLPALSVWFEQSVRGSRRPTGTHPALAGARSFEGAGAVQAVLVAHESVDSITDFGFEGFVKPTLDQLWPLLGGEPSKPHDHRIRRLVVMRSDGRPSGVSLGVARWFALPALKVTPKTGLEPVTQAGVPLPLRLLDFWAWSGSDLVNNAWRGVLAEFLVGSALGCVAGTTRVEWDGCDFRFEGIRVEVKSSAYLQSWNQEGLTQGLSFDIKPKLAWDAETNVSATEASRMADVYVFCLLAHQDKASVDPLNLDQWNFYVIPARKLDETLPTAGRLGLGTLIKLEPEVAAYQVLADAVRRAAAWKGQVRVS